MKAQRDDTRNAEYMVYYSITRNGKTMDYIRQNYTADSFNDLEKLVQEESNMLSRQQNAPFSYEIGTTQGCDWELAKRVGKDRLTGSTK
jgi:hypothetical protein